MIPRFLYPWHFWPLRYWPFKRTQLTTADFTVIHLDASRSEYHAWASRSIRTFPASL